MNAQVDNEQFARFGVDPTRLASRRDLLTRSTFVKQLAMTEAEGVVDTLDDLRPIGLDRDEYQLRLGAQSVGLLLVQTVLSAEACITSRRVYDRGGGLNTFDLQMFLTVVDNTCDLFRKLARDFAVDQYGLREVADATHDILCDDKENCGHESHLSPEQAAATTLGDVAKLKRLSDEIDRINSSLAETPGVTAVGIDIGSILKEAIQRARAAKNGTDASTPG